MPVSAAVPFFRHPMRQRSLAAVAALMLLVSACGGGDDAPAPAPAPGGGTGTAPTPSPAPGTGTGTAPAPTPAPVPTSDNAQFRAEAFVSGIGAAVAQMNQLAQSGYAFMGPIAAGGSQEFADIYVKRGAQAGAQLQYRATASPGSAQEWLAAVNAQGADGYLFKAPYGSLQDMGLLFVKNTATTTRYTYEAAPVLASAAAFMEQANAQGARGFRMLGALAMGGTQFTGYVSNGGSVTCRYETTPRFTSADAMRQGLTAKGAARANYRGPIYVGTDQVELFETCSDQTTPIEYTVRVIPSSGSVSEIVADANANGAEGRIVWGDLAFGVNNYARLYSKGQRVMGHALSGFWYPL